MTEAQMLAQLHQGWEGYKAGPTKSGWSKLLAVLHPDIVWHDAHEQAGHTAQPMVDYTPTAAVVDHFIDCRENGPYWIPDRKAVKVLGPNLAVVYDEIDGEHGCIDVYRFESGQIIEMWTCVAEPTSVNFT